MNSPDCRGDEILDLVYASLDKAGCVPERTENRITALCICCDQRSLIVTLNQNSFLLDCNEGCGVPEILELLERLNVGFPAEGLERSILPKRPGATALTPEQKSFSQRPLIAHTCTEACSALTAELVALVKTTLERFIIFRSATQPVALALWALHTHVFEAFDTTPYIAISSPTKQAGKTRLFDVLAALVARPWRAFDATEAVLFRKIAQGAPTLLLDETDTTFGKDSTMTEGIRAVLNAGFQRGATVSRCSGKSFELQDFGVYCPKAFAGIGNSVPDTVADRSIPIVLQRRGPMDRKPDRLRRETIQSEIEPIGERISAWADEHLSIIGGSRPELPVELSDRQQDAWEILFAIADFAGGDWPAVARRASAELHAGRVDQDIGVLLLEHLRDVFVDRGASTLATKDLIVALVDRGDDSPWARLWSESLTRSDSKGPGSRLAHLLKPYGVTPAQIRLGAETAKGYRRADFKDAWSRYLSASAKLGVSSIRHSENETRKHSSSEQVSQSEDGEQKSPLDEGCYVVSSGCEVSEDPSDSREKAAPTTLSSERPLDAAELTGIFLEVFPSTCEIDPSHTDLHHCAKCGVLVAPARGSVEKGWQTICAECANAGFAEARQ